SPGCRHARAGRGLGGRGGRTGGVQGRHPSAGPARLGKLRKPVFSRHPAKGFGDDDGRSEVQQAPARLGSPLTGLDWSLAHHPAKARCRVRMQPRLRATLQPAPWPAFRCAIDENTGMTSPRLPWAGRLLALLCILLSAFNLRTAVTSLTPLLDSLGQTFG